MVERPLQPPWRALLTDFKDKALNANIRECVLGRIAPLKELMEINRGHLSRVRDAARDRNHMDPSSARAIIENAFRAIENHMLDAVPWPDVAPRD